MKQIIDFLKNFIFPTFHFSIERWKYNKDFGVYVSTFGNVKNKNKETQKILMNKNGYLCVATDFGFINIHRLVLVTFYPVMNMDKLTVDHKDHNKRNNKLYNLEWVTEEENLQRANEDLISFYDIEKYYFQNTDKKIKMISTDIIFHSIKEAALWIMTVDKNMSKLGLERIENKIINAAILSKKWYGTYWMYIK